MYRWVEHIAELELEIEAPTERAVFEDAFETIRELLECERREDARPRAVTLYARDRAALLAEWLAELTFIAETEGLVPERLISLELHETTLRAVLDGTAGTRRTLSRGSPTTGSHSNVRGGPAWCWTCDCGDAPVERGARGDLSASGDGWGEVTAPLQGRRPLPLCAGGGARGLLLLGMLSWT